MNIQRASDSGYEELRRTLCAAELLQDIGESLLHPCGDQVSISFYIGTLHVEIHRIDPREHDMHQDSMYWFDAKDPSAKLPLDITVSVTPDQGHVHLQYVFVNGREVREVRRHLEKIEALATKLEQHIQSLRGEVDTGAVTEEIRDLMDE